MAIETMAEAVAILKQELDEKPLPLDDFMHKQIVDDYLLYYIPDVSERGVKHTNERIYNYVPDFIRWWADQIGTDTLTADDAHALEERFVQKYAINKTKSPTSRIAIDATLSAFADKTLGVFRGNPWRRLVKAYDTTLSRPAHVYKKEDLDKFYKGLGMIARGSKIFTRDQTRQRYQNWFKFLLQTGLREAHAEMFTYNDIFEAVRNVYAKETYRGVSLTTVQNFRGDVFYPIPAAVIVSRHKKDRGEHISKTKGIPELVYIHEDLYQSIRDLYEGIEPKDETDETMLDETLLGVSLAAMQKVGRTTARKVWLKEFTWSLRHTWASVYYIMTGGNLKSLADAGGWTSVDIPFKHYVAVMSERDAYNIVKDYHIYLDPELFNVSKEIEHRVLYPPVARPPVAGEPTLLVSRKQLAIDIAEEVKKQQELEKLK